MILGEPQILGQIKQAVELAKQQNNIPKKLSWIIQQVFATAKLVRNETKVGSQAVSLGFAAAKTGYSNFLTNHKITRCWSLPQAR